MGTLAAPNLVLPLIDLATGALDTGETVEIVLHGDAYPGDKIVLTEIGTTGYYKKETAVDVAAVAQGIYKVYVNTVLKGVFVHGYTALQDHMDSEADPHSVAAAQVSVVDSGSYFTGTDVEDILQEIGADLDTKADTGTALLLDHSDQVVAADKPKVTNLDADQVDGKHAGNSAGNVLALDANGQVPLANIPATLPNKSADMVDGKHVGYAPGTIPEMSGTAEIGKLDTSLMGKKIGGGNINIPLLSTGIVAGRIHTTLTAKKVGAADDNIPQVSTDEPPEAGKVHDSLLGQYGPRTSTKNQADTPAPGKYGGGVVWVEANVPDDTNPITVDSSINWKDRIILLHGYLHNSAVPAQFIPGGTNDQLIRFGIYEESLTDSYLVSGGFYSEGGRSGPGTSPGIGLTNSAGDDILYIWVDSTTGNLMMGKSATANSTKYAVILKVEYSPDQGHVA